MFPGMGSGGGGENNVTVNINGTSAMLVEALASATEQMNLTARGMQVLGDAAKILGDTVAASAGAWLDASASATEYGAKLDYLAAQTRMAAASQAQLAGIVGGSSVGGMAGGMGGMGGMLGGVLGGEGLMGLMGGLGDAISGAAGKMMGFVQQAGAMVTGLISFSVLNDVIQQVQSFTDSLISLNEQTEKNVFSWKYLYGGMGNAQEIAAWTKQFSMQIPYTRQSLLQAITNLAPMGLSVKGLEHYLPMIADLGATRAPNLDIAQVAQVIMSASMGYTRMLKYDLKINPEELMKYGLDATGRGIGMHINDPTTLLPALENYAKAKGLTGAAKDIAHNTFWGAWSSFIDRIQNFELDTGHGLFGSLKTALNDLSSWIDAHSAQIARFSDLIGGTLASAFKGATDIIGQFLNGVGQSGLWDFLHLVIPDLLPSPHPKPKPKPKPPIKPERAPRVPHDPTGPDLNDETVRWGAILQPPQNLSGWQQAGIIIGGALKAIGQGWDAVSKFMQPYVKQAIQDLGDAFKHFSDSLTPDDRRSLKELGGALMAIPWVMLIGFVETLAGFFNFLAWAMKNVIHPLEDFQTRLGQLKDNLQKWSDGLKKNFKEWGGQFIQAMIDGITGKLPDFGKAMGTLAATVANYFQHHSPPKEGPLSSDDQWMPAMLSMWARQLHAGAPQMANALGGVAGAMAGALALRPHGGYGSVRASLGGGGNGPVTVVINASSTVEVLKLIDAMLARRDHRMNITFRAPGGYGSHQFGTIGGVQ